MTTSAGAGGLGPLGPPPPRVHASALLGPTSTAARLLGHPGILLGGPRALLLQLAHPLVAAAVAAHSGFRSDPFARLLRTLSAMGTIAFASPERAGQAVGAVAATHSRITGRAEDGRPYSARDPRLAAWIHATLVDTALAVDQRWLGLLSGGQRAGFYVEMLALARPFGVREDGLPPDLGGFQDWFADQVVALEVGAQARAMAPEVLRPPLARAWGAWARPPERMVWASLAAVTGDLLPAELCLAYGLPRPAGARAAAVAGAAAVSRRLAPLVPTQARRPDTPTRVAAAITRQRPPPAPPSRPGAASVGPASRP